MATSERSNACASENTSVLRQSERTCLCIIRLSFSPPVITSFQRNHTVLRFNNWNSHLSMDILQAPSKLPIWTRKGEQWGSPRGPDKPGGTCPVVSVGTLVLPWLTATRPLLANSEAEQSLSEAGRDCSFWSKERLAVGGERGQEYSDFRLQLYLFFWNSALPS